MEADLVVHLALFVGTIGAVWACMAHLRAKHNDMMRQLDENTRIMSENTRAMIGVNAVLTGMLERWTAEDRDGG